MRKSLEESRKLGKKISQLLNLQEKAEEVVEAINEEIEELEKMAEETVETFEPEPEPVKPRTKKELIAYGKEMGLKINPGLKKADIEKIINEGIFED